MTLLTTGEVCKRFNIHRNTWRVWVLSQHAPQPVPRLPGHPRWHIEDIEAFERGRLVNRPRHVRSVARSA